MPIAIYRRKTMHNQPANSPVHELNRSQTGFPSSYGNKTSEKDEKSTFKPSFGIPLYRTTTGGSVSSRHLFNLESQGYEDDEYELQQKGLTVTSMQGRDAYNNLNKLIQDSNKMDNDLPFVVTNPLPDFLLDEMDYVFILQPIY